MNRHLETKSLLRAASPIGWLLVALSLILAMAGRSSGATDVPYPIVDTGQKQCYDNNGRTVSCTSGDCAGQDGAYDGRQPAYRDNGDGAVTDLVTGLMWPRDPGEKMTWDQAVTGASSFRLAGHNDWRLPTIKELYSLILFTGNTGRSANDATPFIATRYFTFSYGSRARGERHIDSQYWSANKYVGTTMRNNPTAFGVNFADGRIKGYPMKTPDPRRPNKLNYALYVRGNPDYGRNDFVDNGDGAVTDRATGLTWMKVDSGALKAGPHKNGLMNWQEALDFSENLVYAGHSDWRLPNAKELQSIVDYSRSPDTTGTAAIDPVFQATALANEAKQKDFGFYWTSTSHGDGRRPYSQAIYVAFGRAAGFMRNPRTGQAEFMDVHGAGAQRSDPKSGDPSRFPTGRGPQGDTIHIYNLVRCVRGGTVQ